MYICILQDCPIVELNQPIRGRYLSLPDNPIIPWLRNILSRMLNLSWCPQISFLFIQNWLRESRKNCVCIRKCVCVCAFVCVCAVRIGILHYTTKPTKSLRVGQVYAYKGRKFKTKFLKPFKIIIWIILWVKLNKIYNHPEIFSSSCRGWLQKKMINNWNNPGWKKRQIRAPSMAPGASTN